MKAADWSQAVLGRQVLVSSVRASEKRESLEAGLSDSQKSWGLTRKRREICQVLPRVVARTADWWLPPVNSFGKTGNLAFGELGPNRPVWKIGKVGMFVCA